MTKVSSGKPKKGPPAHQNNYAFHHNKSSKLTKHITSLPIRFLCPACVAVIEWRKKYRKYKPLTVVKKCTACGEKKIKDAYHVICGDCVRVTGKCGKCLLPTSQWIKEGAVRCGDVEDIEDNRDKRDFEDIEDAEDAEDVEDNRDSEGESDNNSDSAYDSSDSCDSEDTEN